MTVEELKKELAQTLSITARHLTHLADVWQELRRRGEDLTEMKTGLWQYMPMVASGELQPELVVRYAGNLRLLRRLAMLPPYEQQLIIENGVVTVVEKSEDGLSSRKAEVAQLSASEIRQVFQNKILSRDEQVKIILRRERVVRGKHHDALQSRVTQIAVERSRAKKSRAYHSIALSLLPEEWDGLKKKADAVGVSVASLVASALKVTGLM